MATGSSLTQNYSRSQSEIQGDLHKSDQGDTPEIMDEILTARDLELEVNEDDIEELIMGHEDKLTIEELPRNFE
ncbi:hypothetical protein TNCV_4521001 [Trichonephila clavipes]|nr:hypothetical protein TNCV_4521001 [Trichonephila clavipes]